MYTAVRAEDAGCGTEPECTTLRAMQHDLTKRQWMHIPLLRDMQHDLTKRQWMPIPLHTCYNIRASGEGKTAEEQKYGATAHLCY